MSELNIEIVKGLSSIQTDLTEIKVNIARNTASLDYHIARTNELQDIVEPMAKDFIARQAVEAYELKQQAKWINRLKIPGLIVTSIVAIGTLLTWLGMK